MGIEDEIRSLLHQGVQVKDIIETRGYKKSTVYKVADTIRTFSRNVEPPQWTIENIRLNKYDVRYMPGEAVRIDFSFRNKSSRDFYLINVGIQTEWMTKQNIWFSQTIKEVVRPSYWGKSVSISFPVPNDVALGEYELLFGVEGQYLPVQPNEGGIQTTWSSPIVLNVKRPLLPTKIFLSHSVDDKFLVRELEKKLDEYGIETYIGEDIANPGSFLEDKFKRLIEKSTIFIALLTQSALQSPWVNLEIQYAKQFNKPMILMKDKSVQIESPTEWIEFSRTEPPQNTFQTIMAHLNNLTQNNSVDGVVAGALAVGLFALLVGALTKD